MQVSDVSAVNKIIHFEHLDRLDCKNLGKQPVIMIETS